MFRFAFTVTFRHALKSDKYEWEIKIIFAPGFSSSENINLIQISDKSSL